jgi:hypothetical protein
MIYSINKNRRFWITIILIIFTYVSALNLRSPLSFFLILILLIVPLFYNKYKNVKIFLSFIIVGVPITSFLIIELIFKKKILANFGLAFDNLNNFNDQYCNIYGINPVNYIKNYLFNNNIIEFKILKNVLDFIIKMRI